jgi:hypothetical protein
LYFEIIDYIQANKYVPTYKKIKKHTTVKLDYTGTEEKDIAGRLFHIVQLRGKSNPHVNLLGDWKPCGWIPREENRLRQF